MLYIGQKGFALKTKEIAKRTFAEIKHRTRSYCIESQTKEFAHITRKWDVCIGRGEFLFSKIVFVLVSVRNVWVGGSEYIMEIVNT